MDVSVRAECSKDESRCVSSMCALEEVVEDMMTINKGPRLHQWMRDAVKHGRIILLEP